MIKVRMVGQRRSAASGAQSADEPSVGSTNFRQRIADLAAERCHERVLRAGETQTSSHPAITAYAQFAESGQRIHGRVAAVGFGRPKALISIGFVGTFLGRLPAGNAKPLT